jgi:hypothetical protein
MFMTMGLLRWTNERSLASEIFYCWTGSCFRVSWLQPRTSSQVFSVAHPSRASLYGWSRKCCNSLALK